MAEGLSVALPLRIDPIDGAYGLNRTLTQVAAQNLRMVILTSPGERIMFPDFSWGKNNVPRIWCWNKKIPIRTEYNVNVGSDTK
jgi:hypothetical protein